MLFSGAGRQTTVLRDVCLGSASVSGGALQLCVGSSLGVGSTKVLAPTDHWETRNVKHVGVSIQREGV